MTVSEIPVRSIAEQLEQLSLINDDPAAGGITREVFTATYMRASDVVAELMAQAGLSVRSDAFGNLLGGSMDGTPPPPPC